MSFIKLRWKQQEDILVAAFWSVGMAIGILFISRTPGYSIDLMSFLFGNILLVSKSDLLLMAILDIIIVGIVFLFYKTSLNIPHSHEISRLTFEMQSSWDVLERRVGTEVIHRRIRKSPSMRLRRLRSTIYEIKQLIHFQEGNYNAY